MSRRVRRGHRAEFLKSIAVLAARRAIEHMTAKDGMNRTKLAHDELMYAVLCWVRHEAALYDDLGIE